MSLLKYLAGLSRGKMILWCYMLWYLAIVAMYFDPSPHVWMNSLGISLVVGVGLNLSVSRHKDSNPGVWQTLRLFMMPFGVSSFSSLIKGKGFILILPPRLYEQFLTAGLCLVFIAIVISLKKISQLG